MEVFYAAPESISAGEVAVTGEELHHLARVMRKVPGDEILVTAGQGIMYRTVIEEVTRSEARCSISEDLPGYNELIQDVVLVQGILKNPGKMDFIVEKATELGVRRIIPVQSRYTIAKGGKVDRWRALALAAMKQCGRCSMPAVDDIVSLQQAFESSDGIRIVCYEQEDIALSLERQLEEQLPSGKPVFLFVGPEGGFSDEELDVFKHDGASFASLGGRRLRGETAAMVSVARTAAFIEQYSTSGRNSHVV